MTIYKTLDKDDGYYKLIGKIESIRLGIEGHGLLEISICFKFDGTGQCFSCCLDTAAKVEGDDDNKFIGRLGTVFGCELIRRLCHCFEVETIQDIVGKTAYALYDKEDFQSYIIGIENPGFNRKYTSIRQIIPSKIIQQIEEIEQMQKGKVPFKEIEWS